ncbi:UxaA family hydrolase [Cognatishimia maritima]|uniref:SAF domain-containing protein n=1 Tax=Cognatishimia maritima TaxID=870908 RepID=A0A1M5QL69_9RHOB|nr:UxaA family hydrolase [Cognatishimia maritima]SHH14814.1 SAF domain-containing protein [Cognatishimia maritima]
MTHDPRLLVLSENDNVGILTSTVKAGETIQVAGENVTLPDTLGLGHKLALRNIAKGEDILKYSFPIGFAGTDIPLGTHVHVHNLTSRYTTVEIME